MTTRAPILALSLVLLLFYTVPAFAQAPNTLVGGYYNAVPPTPISGAPYALQFDNFGNVRVTGSGSFNGTVTQGPGNVANPWYVNQSGNWSVRLQDGLGNNVNSTSNALNVYLTGSGVTLSTSISGTVAINCGGVPCLAVDETSFTAGSGTLSTIGLWYQSTNTNNPLTNGQVGVVQGTAYRALFENARDSTGAEILDPTNHAMRIVCSTGVSTSGFCNPVDEAAFTPGSSGFSAIGGLYQTTATSNALTNGEAGTAQLTANRAVFMNPRDSTAAEMANTTAHSMKTSLLDSSGGDMSDPTNHALQVEGFTSAVAITNAFQPLVCTSYKAVHITSGTNTQILAASGSTNVYICDFDFSATAALTFQFEKSSSGTCASPTTIGPLWTLTANQAKANSKPIYTGFNTGASQQLCVNTSAGNIDIGVSYAQF